jgi:hypothetical protein
MAAFFIEFFLTLARFPMDRYAFHIQCIDVNQPVAMQRISYALGCFV